MFRQIRLTAQMAAARSASIISIKAHAQMDSYDGFQKLGFKVGGGVRRKNKLDNSCTIILINSLIFLQNYWTF